uniref:Uncharacterized protein n=1 Tax=Oryza brachyantha TaxID=4533 RepID=J3N6R4_ORYBR
VVDELVERLPVLPSSRIGDAQDGRASPEMAPPPGQDGGHHGLVRRQEGQDVLEESVREDVDPVVFTGVPVPRSLALSLRRHSAEQVVG